jgi:hypothetical protein
VSQLKKHVGSKVIPQPNLPLIDDEGNIKMHPEKLLERRLIPCNNELVVQWLIKWINLKLQRGRTSTSLGKHFQPLILEGKDLNGLGGGHCQAT